MRTLFFFFGMLLIVSLSAQVPSGYYPLKIANQAQNTSNVKATYLIMTAQMYNTAATSCVLQLSWSATNCGYLASLVPVTMQTNAATYSYRLDTLQTCGAAGDTVTIFLPQLQSGRGMISFNYRMQMPPVLSATGSVSLQEPNINNPLDANNGILFDKFEFTYNQSSTMYIDLTAVDFFAIPMKLSLGSQSSGVTTNASRTQLLATMQQTLTAADQSSNKVWSKLVMNSPGDTTILRLASPYLAPKFDLTYLTNAKTYGINYISNLCTYYAQNRNTVIIDCSELNSSGFEVYDIYQQTPAQNPGAYVFTGVMSKDGKTWSFTNRPSGRKRAVTRTINMAQADSYDFFAPGIAPFDTPNKTIKSIIVRQLTSAFTVGLLPAPNRTILNSAYLNPNRFYPATSLLPGASASNGPWYNLYTRAVHSAIPQIYGFAFDDQLGQSGTLTSTNPAQPAIITINSMAGTIIPFYQYFPPLQPISITNAPAFTRNSNGSWSAIINYTVPAGQPGNAQYYFVPYGGSGYITPIDTLVKWQTGSPAAGAAGSTQTDTLTLPASVFVGGNPSGAGIQALSCGGSYACPTRSECITPAGPATISGQTPLPAQNVSWTTPTKLSRRGQGSFWVTTIRWTAPATQVSGTTYYWMLNNANVINVDSLIKLQLPGYSVTPGQTHSVRVAIPASLFSTANPWSAAQLQILTCGGVATCPSTSNLFVPQGSGTVPVSPTPRASEPNPKN